MQSSDSYKWIFVVAGIGQRMSHEMRCRYRHLTPQIKRVALISAFGDAA